MPDHPPQFDEKVIETSSSNRRRIVGSIRLWLGCVLLVAASIVDGRVEAREQPEPPAQPHILFAIADDWGWPHAGAYGDRVVQTPAFDRIAREGLLFHHAYVSSPSCTPSRGAILTGQHHWRLEAAANLWSVFPDKFATFPELLEANGYQSGRSGKAWGPGRTQTPSRPLHGHRFRNLGTFLEERDESKPFVFWLGSNDPHRPYERGSGVARGMNLEDVHLFKHFPDVPAVRSDIADYYWEVERFDRLVAEALTELEARGLLEDTIVVMTGDHGMPFPRCKANLYDSGARVPLAIRFGQHLVPNRAIDDFVSLTDIAPTLLDLCGFETPSDMTGRSLGPILTSDRDGRTQADRQFVIFGKERHVPMQESPDRGGYPSRAIRTHEYLYIRNFTPDRWPAGTPHWEKATIRGVWLGDCDNGPTKTYMVEHRETDDTHRRLYDLSFGKRPAEELYHLPKDPDQLVNVAAQPEYAEVRAALASKLEQQLRQTRDPRVLGVDDTVLAEFEYLGRGPRHPDSNARSSD